jgi:hypothetical protein
MKNIHLLPTDKPSRLGLHNEVLDYAPLFGFELFDKNKNFRHNPVNIYITSDEEIKEGDWIVYCNSVYKVLKVNINKRPVVKMSDGEFELSYFKKIILTTDQDLIKDGVQKINDELLQWFVKNPSCEMVDVQKWASLVECGYSYQIIIPKDEAKERAKNYMSLKGALEPKQETLEKAAHKMLMDFGIMSVGESINVLNVKKLMVLFAKEQVERMYSKEEVIAILEKSRETGLTAEYLLLTEQFKKK